MVVSTTLAAQTQGQTRRPFRNPCTTQENSFDKIARATGGQPFRMVPGEVDKTGAVMEAKLLHDIDVFYASGAVRLGERRVFQVPVDSTIASAAFSVTMPCKQSIVVVRPSGEAVGAAGGPGIKDTHLAGARIVVAARPETGTWQVLVAGQGNYSVSVRAKTPLFLSNFQLVRPGGRPGHEGLFPIEGQPLARDQTARAQMSGPFRSVRFVAVSEAGEVIGPLALAPTAERQEFLGRVTLPAVPFRVAAEGEDERGLPYRRIEPGVREVKTIEITPATRLTEVRPGMIVRVMFHLRNNGAPGTFRIQMAWVGRNFVKTPAATRVTVGTGEVAEIEADVDVPPEAEPGADVLVTVSATRTTPPREENAASLALTVVR